MKLSNRGLLEIAEHEGIVPAPYLDSKGVWTFGIGHTASAGSPDPSTLPRAMPAGGSREAAIDRAIRIFRKDVARFEDRVNQAIKVPLAQHEFDALVSFDFNTGGIFKAKLTEAINRQEADSHRHFMGWLKPPEIRQRRTAEMRLFETGDYDLNGSEIPIWSTDGNGNLEGVIGRIEGSVLLARMSGQMVQVTEVNPPTKGGFLATVTAVLLAIVGLFRK